MPGRVNKPPGRLAQIPTTLGGCGSSKPSQAKPGSACLRCLLSRRSCCCSASRARSTQEAVDLPFTGTGNRPVAGADEWPLRGVGTREQPEDAQKVWDAVRPHLMSQFTARDVANSCSPRLRSQAWPAPKATTRGYKMILHRMATGAQQYSHPISRANYSRQHAPVTGPVRYESATTSACHSGSQQRHAD